MNKYELMYIISADANETERDALVEKFKAFVEGKGGVVTGLDKLGMKKFAYKINFKTEGFYVLMNFTSNPTLPRKMEEQMALTEFFVRKMFIKK